MNTRDVDKCPYCEQYRPTDEELIRYAFFDCSILESCDDCGNRKICRYVASHGGLDKILARRFASYLKIEICDEEY